MTSEEKPALCRPWKKNIPIRKTRSLTESSIILLSLLEFYDQIYRRRRFHCASREWNVSLWLGKYFERSTTVSWPLKNKYFSSSSAEGSASNDFFKNPKINKKGLKNKHRVGPRAVRLLFYGSPQRAEAELFYDNRRQSFGGSLDWQRYLVEEPIDGA